MTALGIDFLSQVAARATGTVPLVEPRLPSRFEGETRRAGLLGEGPEGPVESRIEAETPWSASSLRRTITRPAPAERAPTKAEHPDMAEASTTRPSRPASRKRLRAAPDIEAEIEAEADMPTAFVASPSRAASHEPTVPVAVPPNPILVPPLVEPLWPRLEREMPKRLEPAPASPSPTGRDESGSARRGSPAEETPMPSHAVPALAAAPQPPLLRPNPPPPAAQAMPQRPARREFREVPPVPAPDPVINITIGRVEIRAHVEAASSKPAPARRSAPAPQTLADYLNQRGGSR